VRVRQKTNTGILHCVQDDGVKNKSNGNGNDNGKSNGNGWPWDIFHPTLRKNAKDGGPGDSGTGE